MITSNFTIETVTFDGGSTEGYEYPEISGYGDDVQVDIKYHNYEDKEKSLTVKIGAYLFLPSQLELILKQVENYKLAIKHDI